MPKSVATDAYGNIYVASFGAGEPEGANGRIDIFDSKGLFITEIADSHGPKNLIVDGEGNLYVFDYAEGGVIANEVMLYKPKSGSYDPANGKIAYESPVLMAKIGASFLVGLGINSTNGHLFINRGPRIIEYKSAAEGNGVVNEKIGEGILSNVQGIGLAIDTAHKRIYASDEHRVRVFELEEPHKLLMTIEGSATPSEEEFSNFLSVAVDEGTGHFFIFNGNQVEDLIYEFDEEGNYVETIKHKFQDTFGNEIRVDNGKHSPNGAENPFGGRYLYVPSHPTGTGHSFAFGPPAECPPKLESASATGITESEAELQATIQPCGLETTYTIEYTTREAFEAEGFTGATLAKAGTLPAGASPVEVAVALKGFTPGSAYVFGVFAENAKGPAEAVREFATFPAGESETCPNDAFRIGPSELLPDCRAYELVTPPDTNGRTPLGVGHLGTYFATLGASPDGNAATFEIEGGTIPDFEGTGSYAGDPYVVHRTVGGWQTEYAGPTPAESPELIPGSNSPDQGYSFWNTAGGKGSVAIEEKATTYVRYPDGHSELVGRGGLTDDPRALGLLISEGGGHIVFLSGSIGAPAIQLEESAPPSGTTTIYDRTADEVTHVVSLLPGDETPLEGENAFYEGASPDGKDVAFRLGGKIPTSPLYFRHDNEETYEIAPAGSTFAGFAAEDRRAFYLEGGNLFAYEIGGTENPIAFSATGDVTPVNVAPDGKVAYFLSTSVLGGANPNGATAQAGEENLYRSEEGLVSFVGTVTEEDVEGKVTGIGLEKWAAVVGLGLAAADPSRTTPDGGVLLFESEAALTGYDPEGNSEVYRYDSADDELTCLSCSPTLAPATGDATLQSASPEQGAPQPLGFFAQINNLRADGNRAIFQSPDSLALDDVDGLQDIYEWEAQGIGSCKAAGGCVYLISSGHSRSADYLWAVSDSGDNVFFRSGDLLVGSDKDETPSIYDARVEGGFAEPVEKEPCQGEGCFPSPTPSPAAPNLASKGIGPSGNPDEGQGKRCPKGKHKATRKGKTVCVKKKHHKKHHHPAGKKRKGAGR